MSDLFDDWMTRNAGDAECCAQHARPVPCPLCRQEAAEDRAAADREERHARNR